MPYARSTARRVAASRISDLRKSFVFAKVRTKKLPTYVRDSIFQNCVFQLSAILEDFIFELISAWISKVREDNAGNALLPRDMKVLLLSRSQETIFRKYIFNSDETELTKSIAEVRMIFELFDDTRKFSEESAAVELVKEKKFPSPRNIEALFRRVGLPKVVSKLSRRTRSDFALGLQGFMDTRNALAHESPPSITDDDVGRHFGHIARWINAIDREFYGHVVKCSGAARW